MSKKKEIDDWLVQQVAYRFQPMAVGANIFTHKIIPMKRQEPSDGEGMLSLQRLRGGNSAQRTRENSVPHEDNGMSYFEKIERLKHKIIDTHEKIQSLPNPELTDLLTAAKANQSRPQVQPAHPNWVQEYNNSTASAPVSKDPRARATTNVLSLEAY